MIIQSRIRRFIGVIFCLCLMNICVGHAEETSEFAKAVERYRDRIRKAPNDLKLHREMIEHAQETGRLSVPREIYKDAYERQPTNSIVLYVLAYTYLMDGSASALAEAEKLFQSAIQKHPDFADAHFALGKCYLAQGKTDASAEAFEKSVQLNPSFWEAHFELGDYYRNRKNYPKAIEYYSSALAQKPENAEIQYNLGLVYQKVNNLQAAREAFSAVIKHDKRNADAYYQLGQVYAQEGQPEEALKLYEKAQKLDANNIKAHYQLAHIFLERGNDNDAIMAVQRALAADGQYADYKSLLSGADAPRAAEILARILEERPENAELQRFTGGLFLKLGQQAEARKHLEDAKKLDPNNAEVHLALGQIYATEAPQAAIEAYKQSAALGGANLDMLLQLAETYREEGDFQKFEEIAHQILAIDERQAKIHSQLANDYDKQARRKKQAGEEEEAKKLSELAIKHADKASLLEPNNVAYLLTLGRLYDQQGRIKALRFYDEAIALDPQNAEAYYLRGAFMSNYSFGEAKALLYEPKDVLDDLKRAVELNPNLAGAHYALGVAYDRMDDVENALTAFQRAAELDPSDPRPHLYLGEKYANSGQPHRAIAAFAKAIKADPENVEALKDYAYLCLAYDEERGWKQAKRALETAIQIRPNDSEILMNYGYTLFLSRKNDEAIYHYRRALELKPNWGLCRYNLGVAYERIGQKGLALAEYQKVVQLDREGSHREKALERIEALTGKK